MGKTALHWFRKGLRLHDNLPLIRAIGASSSLIPLYILDTNELEPGKVGINRMGFLLDSLNALDSDLRAKGSRLFVAKGNPNEIIGKMIKELKVEVLSFERSTEPYNKAMDERILNTAALSNVEAFPEWGHTMFDPEYLLSLNKGEAPLTMESFMELMSRAEDPPKPLDSPGSIPPPPAGDMTCKGIFIFEGVPALADLTEYNYDAKNYISRFAAGETEGIRRMKEFLSKKIKVATFEKPRAIDPSYILPETTALSPYMSKGSLSSRLFYHSLKDTLHGISGSKPPVSLKGQLYWREMAYLIGFSVSNFNQMEGNPVCKQIPWLEGNEASPFLDKWEMGQTGYPAVDAVMNQLRTEGWLHDSARQLVACFLTRGDLWVTWELGRDMFEKYLLDADWSVNNFSWHMLSCSAFSDDYSSCYDPSDFFKEADPTGNYVKKFVPALKKFPAEYVYQPWTAPENLQKTCGCVIGEDYPKPIVEHTKVFKENVSRMKKAYSANNE